MRVVGGSARGKQLQLVPGDGTRPILDRVKTSLFDILRPQIEGKRILDLFGGSGGVGIEALSQGAEHCTFLDLARKAVKTIEKNLATTGLAGQAVVLHANALDFLKRTDATFDLIYVAPPQYKDLWIQAMQQIDERPALLRRGGAPSLVESESESESEPGMVIVQIDPKEYVTLELGTLREIQQRRYGNTLLIFFETSEDETRDDPSVATRSPEAEAEETTP